MTHGPAQSRTPLGELALLFLRLGATAFGGPAAHIAMMQDEVVKRRRWLTDERFLDLLGATNLIPGPNSTEMAIHIGWDRRRWAGLIVAGLAFILPAMAITGALAWAYVRFGSLPAIGWLLYGVKPVILGVVAHAIWGLAPRAAKTPRLRALAALAAILSVLEVNYAHRIGQDSGSHAASTGAHPARGNHGLYFERRSPAVALLGVLQDGLGVVR
jgi:chromate transporter